MLNTKTKGQKRQTNSSRNNQQDFNINEKNTPQDIIQALLHKLRKEKGLKQNYKKKYLQKTLILNQMQERMNQFLENYYKMKVKFTEIIKLTSFTPFSDLNFQQLCNGKGQIYANVKRDKGINYQQNKKSLKEKYFIENVEHAVSIQQIQTIISALNQDKFNKQMQDQQINNIYPNYTNSSANKKLLKTKSNDNEFSKKINLKQKLDNEKIIRKHKKDSKSQLVKPKKEFKGNYKGNKTWQEVSKVLGLMIQSKENYVYNKKDQLNKNNRGYSDRRRSKSMDNLNKLNMINRETICQKNIQNDHLAEKKSMNVSINQYLAQFNSQCQNQLFLKNGCQKLKINYSIPERKKALFQRTYDENLFDLIEEIYL